MKKTYLALFCVFALIASNLYAKPEYNEMVRILDVLLPEGLGDISLIDQEPVETNITGVSPASDGNIHFGGYKNGFVSTIISTTGPKKHLGEQRIICNGKVFSLSSDFTLDENNPETIIHIHRKYLVYTSPTLQTIEPRTK